MEKFNDFVDSLESLEFFGTQFQRILPLKFFLSLYRDYMYIIIKIENFGILGGFGHGRSEKPRSKKDPDFSKIPKNPFFSTYLLDNQLLNVLELDSKEFQRFQRSCKLGGLSWI